MTRVVVYVVGAVAGALFGLVAAKDIVTSVDLVRWSLADPGGARS